MSSVFCCSRAQSYKNKNLSEESKFRAFLAWAEYPKESEIYSTSKATVTTTTYAIQIVKQVNFGPLESKRYYMFNGAEGDGDAFVEVTEQWLIDANFQKLNAFVLLYDLESRLYS